MIPVIIRIDIHVIPTIIQFFKEGTTIYIVVVMNKSEVDTIRPTPPRVVKPFFKPFH